LLADQSVQAATSSLQIPSPRFLAQPPGVGLRQAANLQERSSNLDQALGELAVLREMPLDGGISVSSSKPPFRFGKDINRRHTLNLASIISGNSLSDFGVPSGIRLGSNRRLHARQNPMRKRKPLIRGQLQYFGNQCFD
jgi:hypothetical protein